jgi:hypothetical protein
MTGSSGGASLCREGASDSEQAIVSARHNHTVRAGWSSSFLMPATLGTVRAPGLVLWVRLTRRPRPCILSAMKFVQLTTRTTTTTRTGGPAVVRT